MRVTGRQVEISLTPQKSRYGKLPLLRSLGRKVGLSEAMRKVVVYAQSPRENSASEHGHFEHPFDRNVFRAGRI